MLLASTGCDDPFTSTTDGQGGASTSTTTSAPGGAMTATSSSTTSAAGGAGAGGSGTGGSIPDATSCPMLAAPLEIAGCPSLHFTQENRNCGNDGHLADWNGCTRNWNSEQNIPVLPINNTIANPCTNPPRPSLAPVCVGDGIQFYACDRMLLEASVPNINELVFPGGPNGGAVTVVGATKAAAGPVPDSGWVNLGSPNHNCDFMSVSHDFYGDLGASAGRNDANCGGGSSIGQSNSKAALALLNDDVHFAEFQWGAASVGTALAPATTVYGNQHSAPLTAAYGLATTGTNLVIGGINPQNEGTGFEGWMYEMHIYGCALSQQQRADIKVDIETRHSF